LDKEASIKDMTTALPASRCFELFIAADSVVQAVKVVAKTLGEGEEFPFEMATVNAPLAVSSAMIGSVAQVNIVVPTKLIKAIKEAVEKQSAAGAKDFDEDEEDAEDGEKAKMDKDEDSPPAKTKTKAKAKDKDKDEDEDEDEGEDEDKDE
jgi:hypothetical protein